jgi:hypothetical protein
MAQPRPGAGIGTAVHNGWVILVTVADDHGRPRVVDRRRVELVPPGVPSQPYHHEGRSLPFAEADAIVRRVQDVVLGHARAALAAYVEELSTTADVRAVTLPQPRDVPWDLADVLAGRQTVYVADRHLYEVAVARAAAALAIDVVTYPRKGEFAFAASGLQLPERAIRTCTSRARAAVGPPWRQEHQEAMAAALGALARMPAMAGIAPAAAMRLEHDA